MVTKQTSRKTTTTVNTRSQLKQKLEKIEKKEKKKSKRFVSVENRKLLASSAKYLPSIVGEKQPISRAEIARRAKHLLRIDDEDVRDLKITKSALAVLREAIVYRFCCSLRIAKVLTSYAKTQTVNALTLNLAGMLMKNDWKQQTTEEFEKIIAQLRGTKYEEITVTADAMYSAFQKVIKEDPEMKVTETSIVECFKDSQRLREVTELLDEYRERKKRVQ
ncbi:hypothetical protein FDP41_011828 [Naegleria fowleri]|uniref:Uncharacterized protein n=1 Tax=Naegleria fowleri TaxID=5763 RepID=A0A6A5BXH8_NAEFO|nr:uncharacterized protein FDP41_011828 [Naegleria fowleri]KAF0981967.1 hypothetical protein FDP41_011828 [Naegleria fowleri]CAG4712184.1 unnamed protein product [Naegleria fowleri]